MQFNLFNYSFKTNLWQVLLVLVFVFTFIKLGLWQHGKAEYKQGIEDAYQQSLKASTQGLESNLDKAAELEFKKVGVSGRYESEYQILIDNKVENGRAGFHVVTPFKINNTDLYVLVNRGWVAGVDDHQMTPNFDTPEGDAEIEGMVWIPTKKIFSLEKMDENKTTKSWTLVWQHLDMERYQKEAPIKVLDVIVKLDPAQEKGGFVRNWQLPPSRIATNLGYAYQWFGFAFTTVLIFLYMSVTKLKRPE